jgi:hypothetical protein
MAGVSGSPRAVVVQVGPAAARDSVTATVSLARARAGARPRGRGAARGAAARAAGYRTTTVDCSRCRVQ